MKMKIIKIASLGAIAITIGFNACGDSLDCDTTIGTRIAIDVFCNDTDSIESYIVLEKNDIIIKEEENTEITIYHNEDDFKVVCVNSGSAFISRGGIN